YTTRFRADAREVVEGGAGGGVDAVGLLEPAPDEQAAGEVPEVAGVGVRQPAARPGGADLADALAVLAGDRHQLRLRAVLPPVAEQGHEVALERGEPPEVLVEEPSDLGVLGQPVDRLLE